MSGMNGTILLADDSSTIRKIVELTFQDSGIRVETVESGQHALEKLDELEPDLLLADVIMPEPGGYDLCHQVKGSERPIPVVLLTGAFEAFDADRARDCGADDRLVKPFESQMLRDTVERLLQEAATQECAVPEPAVEDDPATDDAEELDALGAELEESRPDTAAEDGEPGHRDGTQPDSDDEAIYEVAADWGFDGPGERVAVEVGQESTATEAPASDSEAHANLTPADVAAVADAVVQRLSGDVVRELAREMLPDIARELVRQRIRELEETED